MKVQEFKLSYVFSALVCDITKTVCEVHPNKSQKLVNEKTTLCLHKTSSSPRSIGAVVFES